VWYLFEFTASCHISSSPKTYFSQQNNVIKTREDKYRSKIKVLETLLNGTNDENEVIVSLVMI
jgi:hypothetical protein